MPWMMKAPIRAAATELPGIPSVIVGTKEPPTHPLFPASAAATPSGLPFPNRCLTFEICLEKLYEINAAIVAPSPGRTPITVPVPDP